jgi:hypothetical protein
VTAPPTIRRGASTRRSGGITLLVVLGSAGHLACSAPPLREHVAPEISPAGEVDEASAQGSAEEAEVPRPVKSAESADASCRAPADAASVARDIAIFRRWLLDQSVGRHVTIVRFAPSCGDEQGLFAVALTLRGTADELLSLGRAFDAYYPGASWRALGHERLGESPLALQIDIEIGVPSGATPRPRCVFDPATPCPAEP